MKAKTEEKTEFKHKYIWIIVAVLASIVLILLGLFLPKSCGAKEDTTYSVYQHLYDKCLTIVENKSGVKVNKVVAFRYTSENQCFSFSTIDESKNQYICDIDNTGFEFNEEGINAFIKETTFTSVTSKVMKTPSIDASPYLSTITQDSLCTYACNEFEGLSVSCLCGTVYMGNMGIQSMFKAEYQAGSSTLNTTNPPQCITYKADSGMIYKMNEYILMRNK